PLIEPLAPTEVGRLAADVAARLERYRAGDVLRIPAQAQLAWGRAESCRLLHDAGDLEREARDASREDAAGLGVHLVHPLHRADGRGEDRAAAVAVRIAGIQHGLLADDARSLNLLDVSVAVGDDPVSAAQLDAGCALVGDGHRVGEGEAALFRGR